MHECPDCGQTCDCDGEDVWNDWAGRTCRHACDDEDDVLYLDDHAWSGVLTLDAAAFAIGTVLTLTEPTEEPMNPLAEKLGISIEKAGVWRITPDGLERIEEQPVIRCEAINPRWTGKPRRKWKLRRKRNR